MHMQARQTRHETFVFPLVVRRLHNPDQITFLPVRALWEFLDEKKIKNKSRRRWLALA